MRLNFCVEGNVIKTEEIAEPVTAAAVVEVREKKTGVLLHSFSYAPLAIMAGRMAAEATMDGTFGNVFEAVMKAFDAGVVLVIIFAGASWSLGHRTKAIEILIGVCCGYLLARHSLDIRDFLKQI